MLWCIHNHLSLALFLTELELGSLFFFDDTFSFPGKLPSLSYKWPYGGPICQVCKVPSSQLTHILSKCDFITDLFSIFCHSVQLLYKRISNIKSLWWSLKWQKALKRDSISKSFPQPFTAAMFQKFIIRINLAVNEVITNKIWSKKVAYFICIQEYV